MPLPDEIRDLADRILGRLDEARNVYLHTQQAWRLVQIIAHEGRSVGIVDTPTGREVPALDLETMGRVACSRCARAWFRSPPRTGLRCARACHTPETVSLLIWRTSGF